MTVKELKEKLKGLPDDSKVAVLLTGVVNLETKIELQVIVKGRRITLKEFGKGKLL